jgi:hypothetical protein
MSRLLGIKIIAGLHFFFGGLFLIISLGGILTIPNEAIPLILPFLFGAVVAIFYIFVGYGLLKFKLWAYFYTLITQILCALYAVVSLPTTIQTLLSLPNILSASGRPGVKVTLSLNPLISLISLIFSFVIIYYLFKQDVKQAFFRKKIA